MLKNGKIKEILPNDENNSKMLNDLNVNLIKIKKKKEKKKLKIAQLKVQKNQIKEENNSLHIDLH